MTAYTANTSGLWNSAATWSGAGTPSVNGDTWTINVGVDVEMNVDQSALTVGLGAGTINGTLHFSRTAGAYVLKMGAGITCNNGCTLDASNGSGGAYPANCTATILFTAAGSIISGATAVINLLCQDTPTHKYVKLSQAEIVGATTLHVDTDLTGGGDSSYWGATVWGSPGLIRVDNVNKTNQSEERTISSVTSTTIVITSGLTNSKLIGAYVILLSRNVKVIGNSSSVAFNTMTGGIVNAEIRLWASHFNNIAFCVIGGALADSAANGIVGGGSIGCTINASISGLSGVAISGAGNMIINGIISGCGTVLSGNGGSVISATAELTGNGIGVGGGVSPVWVYGRIENNTTGIVAALQGGIGGLVCSGAVIQNNTQDMSQVQSGTLYNTLLGSTTEFQNYNAAYRPAWAYVESFDHDQVVGAYRNWCVGGITNLTVGTVYPGRVHSYQHALELPRAGVYSFRQVHVSVPAGGWINATCFIQKDASMAFLPRIQIFSADKEPLISGAADSTATMTNSTNTWEVLAPAPIQNTAVYPKDYIVRIIGSNASGNFFEDCDISTSPFGWALGEAA